VLPSRCIWPLAIQTLDLPTELHPRFKQEEASTYYDTSSEIMDLLAHESVSTDVIDDVCHIFASQRKP
jgi:hypothetical protein